MFSGDTTKDCSSELRGEEKVIGVGQRMKRGSSSVVVLVL